MVTDCGGYKRSVEHENIEEIGLFMAVNAVGDQAGNVGAVVLRPVC